MAFIDDSPPLQTWGPGNMVVDSEDESDRSSGRAVLGTAAGDLYVFIQRGVRLIPREARRVYQNDRRVYVRFGCRERFGLSPFDRSVGWDTRQ